MRSHQKYQIRKQLKYEKKKYEELNNFIFVNAGRAYTYLTPTQQWLFMFAIVMTVTPVLSLQDQNEQKVKTIAAKGVQRTTFEFTPFAGTKPAVTMPDAPDLLSYHLLNSSNMFAGANSAHQQKSANKNKKQEPEIVSYYSGIPIKDISLLKKDCVKKEIGHSSGKICIIEDGKKYYMKSLTDEHQNGLLGAYNARLLRDNMGIHVPSEMIFSDSGRFYFATQAVSGFVSAEDIKTEGFRGNLVKKIGEKGISKFMTALTFISDLKLENWGYDKNGLVLIDVDIAPRKFEEFIARSEAVSKYGERIPLSLNNIKEMRLIYNNMLTKSLPSIDGSVDINDDVYKQVLTIFSRACEMIIKNFPLTFPSLKETIASAEINKCFEEKVKEIMKKNLDAECSPDFKF